ncbi:restriction endonuclease subunit S [Candidatus Mycoplasma haematohominis]|uniref:Putative type-1 restriction enzyme specificity protein MPN_089 n=1 Tax=Candidatus Mycoplasma haematohominis TaxID=1494318 RepID=A0A478FUB7_9MOLU|nr:restriction endonuclease subunit S [Candidatus Mycoplasma haemohominis]GCE63926.1 putative type-1 restriction enzyme specificity protein MPN_089 [Candidatus Mycoplasma haemohominis]
MPPTSILDLLTKLDKKDWKKIILKDVVDIQRGFSFDDKKYKKSGLPIIKVLNVQQGKINVENLVYFDPNDYPRDLSKFLLKPGEICITVSGASSGKIAINNINQDFYLSSTVCKLNAKENIVPKYLYHSLLYIHKEIKNLVRGGAVKGLPIKQLEQLKIPFPPINIQKKIAYLLDELRTKKEELKEDLLKEININEKKYEYYRNLLFSL